MSRFIDITGNKYNKLMVLFFYGIKDNRSYSLCKCKCGNTKVLPKNQLSRLKRGINIKEVLTRPIDIKKRNKLYKGKE